MTTQASHSAATEKTDSAVFTVLTGLLRITTGWMLFWAGIDKVFGLGYATPRSESVIEGTSAASGFLQFGVNEDSPFAGVLNSMAGSMVVDILYLLATVGAGLAIMLGVGVRIAGIGGAILFASIWAASIPLEYNPILDQHAVYAIVCLVIAFSTWDQNLGLGSWWRSKGLGARSTWLA